MQENCESNSKLRENRQLASGESFQKQSSGYLKLFSLSLNCIARCQFDRESWNECCWRVQFTWERLQWQWTPSFISFLIKITECDVNGSRMAQLPSPETQNSAQRIRSTLVSKRFFFAAFSTICGALLIFHLFPTFDRPKTHTFRNIAFPVTRSMHYSHCAECVCLFFIFHSSGSRVPPRICGTTHKCPMQRSLPLWRRKRTNGICSEQLSTLTVPITSCVLRRRWISLNSIHLLLS